MFMHVLTVLSFCASLLFWSMMVALVVAIMTEIYYHTLRYETSTGSSTIIRTELEDSAMFEPDYYVYVNYQGKEYYIKDEKLYEEAIIGNVIPVNVHRGYNRANKMKNLYLTKH